MTITKQGGNIENAAPHWLEWVVGAVSTLVVAALIGWIGYEAVTATSAPPDLTIHKLGTDRLEAGWRVNFEIRNHAPSSAAGVEVRGEVLDGSEPLEGAEVTFDYVPAHSRARGALIFTHDPKDKTLRLSAVGMTEP
ncbi:TIGR02588 family protein [Allorhizobium undicola]|uniref:TIGR02588 family protein n=1 Tax=Allorhizobium undicola TaxID=78527 RepID=UPI0004813C9B|nr:TIGR02588 family protein [Allorhizobium undicola]